MSVKSRGGLADELGRMESALRAATENPAQKLHGVALFGPAGVPGVVDPAWPLAGDGPIRDELVAEASNQFGFRVIPTP